MTTTKKAQRGVPYEQSPRELIVVLSGSQAPAALSAGGGVADILSSAGARMTPLFAEERSAGAPDAALTNGGQASYFHVEAEDKSLDKLCRELEVAAGVEAAYIKPPSETPHTAPALKKSQAAMVAEMAINDMLPTTEEAPAVTPNFTARQGYLNPAPGGIDAYYAWGFPGPRYNYQGRDDQRGYIAIEWWPEDFAAIRYATNKGIIVVEAAGNGRENFDDALYDQRPAGFPQSWRNPYNPANTSSRAVIVGAGAPPPGTHGRDHGPDRSRLDFSNYGRRVDAQGWGREVTTTGYGDLQSGGQDKEYTDQFSGTSSASPIVTAALACVNGALKSNGQSTLTPLSAISLLRSTGSPQTDAPGHRPLLPMGECIVAELRRQVAAAVP